MPTYDQKTCLSTKTFPGGLAISTCRFAGNSGLILLGSPLMRNTQYSLTIKILNPATVIEKTLTKAELKTVSDNISIKGVGDPATSGYKEYGEILVDGITIGSITDPDRSTLQKGEYVLPDGTLGPLYLLL